MSSSLNIEELAARLQRLEEREAIIEHGQGFAAAADPNMDIDAFVNLYAEDGVMEIVNWDRYEGREEIAAFLAINPFQWMFHCLIPLKIDIADDCQSARTRWYLWEAALVHNSKTGKQDPVWVAGAYDNELVKVNGEWKYALTRLTQQIVTSYEQGWGESRINLSPDWMKPVEEFASRS